MKNYEKYADEIKGYKGLDFCGDIVIPYVLKSEDCGDMTCNRCYILQMLWLMEEYKEPEVDWSKVKVDTPILVRDSENTEWLKNTSQSMRMELYTCGILDGQVGLRLMTKVCLLGDMLN